MTRMLEESHGGTAVPSTAEGTQTGVASDPSSGGAVAELVSSATVAPPFSGVVHGLVDQLSAERRQVGSAAEEADVRRAERRVRVLHAAVTLLNHLDGDDARLELASRTAVDVLRTLDVADLYGVVDHRGRRLAKEALLRAMDAAVHENALTDGEGPLADVGRTGAASTSPGATAPVAGTAGATPRAGEDAQDKSGAATARRAAFARAREALGSEADSTMPTEMSRESPLSHRLAFAFYMRGLCDDAVIVLFGAVDERVLDGMASGLRAYARSLDQHQVLEPDLLCGHALHGSGLITVQGQTEFFRGIKV